MHRCWGGCVLAVELPPCCCASAQGPGANDDDSGAGGGPAGAVEGPHPRHVPAAGACARNRGTCMQQRWACLPLRRGFERELLGQCAHPMRTDKSHGPHCCGTPSLWVPAPGCCARLISVLACISYRTQASTARFCWAGCASPPTSPLSERSVERGLTGVMLTAPGACGAGAGSFLGEGWSCRVGQGQA